jgi:cytochrome P450
MRKAMLPAFSFRHIKDLYPVFWLKACESVKAIAEAQQTDADTKQPSPQSAYLWASRTSLDIIGLAGAGHDFKALQNPDDELLVTYRSLFDEEGPLFFFETIGLNIPVEQLIKLPLKTFGKLRRASSRMREFALDLIRTKQRDLLATNQMSNDILGIALSSGAFDEQGLVGQLMTFLAAGHETTASALVWAVYLLAKHPYIQTRLRKEVREELPSPSKKEANVDAHLIDKLSYLNAVCNEVLRFFPSAPMTARVAAVNTTICTQPIPKGTPIIISSWATNVSRDLWGEDAMVFNPERWLKPGQSHTGGVSSNFANLTFLHGPRSCIGKDFARSEFACLLAAWVGRFELSFPDGVVPPPEYIGYVTAKPRYGMPMVFKEVEG